MKISVMLLPARVDVFRRHVHPSRVVASCLQWRRKSQHGATAQRRVAELEMIELDGAEDDDTMKLAYRCVQHDGTSSGEDVKLFFKSRK